MRVTSTTTIASTAQAIWDVLTDYPDYPTWNPFIVSASTRGRSLTLAIDTDPDARMLSCDARIVRSEAAALLKIRLEIAPGFINGRYAAHLAEDERAVRLTQDLRFGGLVSRLYIRPWLLADLRRGLDAMGAALKRQVEAR